MKSRAGAPADDARLGSRGWHLAWFRFGAPDMANPFGDLDEAGTPSKLYISQDKLTVVAGRMLDPQVRNQVVVSKFAADPFGPPSGSVKLRGCDYVRSLFIRIGRCCALIHAPRLNSPRAGRRSSGEEQTMPEDETMGPVSYLIVEFPGSKMTGEGFPILVDLVNSGVIRVLDLRFMTKAPDGTVRALELSDIDRDGQFDLTVFEGASSGLMDQSDFADAASVIKPGSSAGVLIFENRWATPFVNALRRGQAELVAAGYIPVEALMASLDATERAGS